MCKCCVVNTCLWKSAADAGETPAMQYVGAMRLKTARFAVALLLLTCAACRDSTLPTRATPGTYELTQIVVGDMHLSTPSNVSPFVSSGAGYGSVGEYWITSGSLTLRSDGYFVMMERDSLYCSYCAPTFVIRTKTGGGHWTISQAVLTTADTGGAPPTLGGHLEDSNVYVRVPFAALVGEYVYSKR